MVNASVRWQAISSKPCAAAARHCKTWVNTSLGETWEEDQGERPDWATLQARAEPYHVLSVPAGGLFLTAGVDVQDDRLAVVIVAWGRGEESWRVYWGELYGDPSLAGGVWAQLDDLLTRGYEHESGVLLHVTGAAVDSGLHTHHVYNYCRSRAPRVMAVKGDGTARAPDHHAPGRPGRAVQGHDHQERRHALDDRGRWGEAPDLPPAENHRAGPGLHALPDRACPRNTMSSSRPRSWCTRYKHGVPYTEWHKPPGQRNEALDCEVYAYAAAIRNGMGRLDWATARASLALRAGSADVSPPMVPPPVTPQPPGRRVRSRGI